MHRPYRLHQSRIELTASSEVSLLVDTQTWPRLRPGSSTPYGTARHSASPGKSCAFTSSACRHQRVPGFLKLPINTEFLVSVLITTHTGTQESALAASQSSGTAGCDRDGAGHEPLDVGLERKPSSRSRRPIVTWQTVFNCLANHLRLVRTNLRFPSGSPPASGSIKRGNCPSKAGCFFQRAAARRRVAAPGRQDNSSVTRSPRDGQSARFAGPVPSASRAGRRHRARPLSRSALRPSDARIRSTDRKPPQPRLPTPMLTPRSPTRVTQPPPCVCLLPWIW